VEGCGSLTKSVRTCRRSGLGWGRPIAAARREQAAGSRGERRRRRSGGREQQGRGQEASGWCGEVKVGSIRVEEGQEGVLHGEQGVAAGGGRRQWCSGRNSTVFRGW
jgi:hypothetical protein